MAKSEMEWDWDFCVLPVPQGDGEDQCGNTLISMSST